MEETKKRSLGTGEAILLAGFLIAIAIFITNTDGLKKAENNDTVGGKVTVTDSTKIDIKDLIGPDDNIRGNTDAEVFIIEYSDYDCPFCARFHPTMTQVMNNYGGKVAWVYKQFPLNIHPNAAFKSKAALCVSKELGGDVFWKFTDTLFSSEIDVTGTKDLAVSLGMSSTGFDTCVNSMEIANAIDADTKEGQSYGATGTPFAIAVNTDGEVELIKGALPLADVSKVIDSLLVK